MMTWDLWGPPHQVPQETCNSLLPGSCNFHDGSGVVDMVEENPLNEISCKQVLRILIQNADAEINELENELVSLNNGLAWVENEEWPRICCNALKQKINCLSLSLRSLRSRNEDGPSECFKMQEPAESIFEILKGLLTNYHGNNLQKNGQPLDFCLEESSSYVPGDVTTDLLSWDKEKTPVPDTVGKDDDQIISCISKECEAKNLFLELQEEKSVNSEKSEHFEGATTTEANTQDPFKFVEECDSDQKNISSHAEAAAPPGTAGKTTVKLKGGDLLLVEWTKEAENVPLASIFNLQDHISKSAIKSPREKAPKLVVEVTGDGQSESDLSSMVQQQQQLELELELGKRKVVGTSKESVVSKSKEGSKQKVARKGRLVSAPPVQKKERKRKEFAGAASAEMTNALLNGGGGGGGGEITECSSSSSSMMDVLVNELVASSAAGVVDMSCLLLPDLRAIAKELKLKSTAKLKKPVLIQQITKALHGE